MIQFDTYSMMKFLLAAVTLASIIQDTNAVYCVRKRYNSLFTTSFYCSGYCCGDSCCYYNIDLSTSHGQLAGAIVGGVVGVCFLIAFLVFIVKVCCLKSGTTGRVVQTSNPQPNPGVYVMTTGTAPAAYPQSQPVAPPPYPVGGDAFTPSVCQYNQTDKY